MVTALEAAYRWTSGSLTYSSCATAGCGECASTPSEPKPSKPWGCRSKTLTPTPEPAGQSASTHLPPFRLRFESFAHFRRAWCIRAAVRPLAHDDGLQSAPVEGRRREIDGRH